MASVAPRAVDGHPAPERAAMRKWSRRRPGFHLGSGCYDTEPIRHPRV